MKVSWEDEIPNMGEKKKCSKPPTSVSSYATGSFWDHFMGNTLMRENRFETWLGSRGAAMVIRPYFSGKMTTQHIPSCKANMIPPYIAKLS